MWTLLVLLQRAADTQNPLLREKLIYEALGLIYSNPIFRLLDMLKGVKR